VTTWSIGEVAAKCGLSEYTLRWYERIGLLDRVGRGSDGRRRFTSRDLDWIMLVTRLRATGMSVKEMQRYAELVRAGGGEQERLELLTEHRRRVRAALVEQQECLQMLDAKIRTYRRTVRSAAKENTDA
jgi:DNA-binding transcriptional MerR regulator